MESRRIEAPLCRSQRTVRDPAYHTRRPVVHLQPELGTLYTQEIFSNEQNRIIARSSESYLARRQDISQDPGTSKLERNDIQSRRIAQQDLWKDDR